MEWEAPSPCFARLAWGSAVRDSLGKSSGGRANEMPLDRRVLYDTDPAVTHCRIGRGRITKYRQRRLV